METAKSTKPTNAAPARDGESQFHFDGMNSLPLDNPQIAEILNLGRPA